MRTSSNDKCISCDSVETLEQLYSKSIQTFSDLKCSNVCNSSISSSICSINSSSSSLCISICSSRYMYHTELFSFTVIDNSVRLWCMIIDEAHSVLNAWVYSQGGVMGRWQMQSIGLAE